MVSETRKGSKLPFSRFEQLVHRFYDWRDSGRTDIRTFVGPSFDYDVEALKGVGRLGARRGAQSRRPARSQPGRIEDLQAAGIIGFHTSLAGCGKTHDRWNGRAGDFDYQISILRTAGLGGMARQERLFLTRNTLPLFDQLLDIMEAIPGELRSRITEEIRDTLPERSRAGDRRHSDYVGAREEIKVIDATARIRLRRPPRAAPHDAVVNLANADAPVP